MSEGARGGGGQSKAVARAGPAAEDGRPTVLILVKAVPGAKREGIAGRLGERLKVRVSAPAEDGKANRAIARVLARELGVNERDVELVRGATSAEKTFRVAGVRAEDVEGRW